MENKDSNEPKELTLSEYKKAMRALFTVRHDVVEECGHKYNPNVPPRHTNCESCLFTWFNLHGDLTATLDEAYQKGEQQVIIQRYGIKFYKNFLRFMSTIAHLRDLERIDESK